MFRWRKLSVAAAAVVGVLGLAAVPSASADPCTVTVTLLGGQKLSFNVDAPPGTPVSALPLPIVGPIISSTETCQSSSSSGTTTTTTTTSSSSSTSSSTTTTQKPPHITGPATNQTPSTHPGGKPGQQNSSKGGSGGNGNGAGAPGNNAAKVTPRIPPVPLRGPGGEPTAANPTFSFALPGPAPLGVPNFFIDSFRIPPFLLPIYQAAGIQYDVPWQILAAINEIETDYGRNLSVSSAGAVGWMQFLPSTWKTWGVDANGDGVADPYNPVDAIFSAARYLQAAGASKNLSRAIFAYNHASWYVQSVLLRAKLVGGMPDQLIGALTGLVDGHFPIAAKAKYADDSVEQLATRRVNGGNAAIAIDSTAAKSVSIYAKQDSPVIAVNDGKIVRVGQSRAWGKFIQLQDQTGNTYTYTHLGSVPKDYAVPKPVKLSAKQLAKQLALPPLPAPPKAPATAGQQQTTPPTVTTAKATAEVKHAPLSLPVTPQPASPRTSAATDGSAPLVKERLFANPLRTASYAAGGKLQLRNAQAEISNFQNYFSDVLHLGKNQYTLAPLKAGAIIVAGTIIGRVGADTSTSASHMQFMVQPAGKNAPFIDPKPILDGWKLLEATAVYRAAGVDPFFGPGAKDPSVGQILLMSKEQLTNRVLQDPHVQIYQCGRRDIEAGLIDRRIMAVIEFLSASGLYPTVSGLECGHSITGSTGTDAAGATGSSLDISRINNIPMLGHQGSGSITDITIRRLLTLQGAMRPDQIISLMSYRGQSNTLALPDHGNRLQVSFTPLFGANKKLSGQIRSILKPHEWIQLINHLSTIPEPAVPISPSKYAIRTGAS